MAAATKVLQSLVPNAQKVFRVLLDAVVDSEDASAGAGGHVATRLCVLYPPTELRFADLFKTCRDAFLVQNEITLRAHLTEFKDHSLVVSRCACLVRVGKVCPTRCVHRRAPDGVEFLGVPFDYDSVLKLYEQIEMQLA